VAVERRADKCGGSSPKVFARRPGPRFVRLPAAGQHRNSKEAGRRLSQVVNAKNALLCAATNDELVVTDARRNPFLFDPAQALFDLNAEKPKESLPDFT